jgi:GGDEF domain-containing protein
VAFSVYLFHAAEIGLLLEIILFAFKLANQFNRIQNEKSIAVRLVEKDTLTHLNNRRGFFNTAESTLSSGLRHKRNIWLIMLDIHNFKQINDSYGHNFGDDVLVAISDQIIKAARRENVIDRLGGEEIELSVGTLPISFSASLGVSNLTDLYHSLDVLINISDKNMYEAKRRCKNQVCFDMGTSKSCLPSLSSSASEIMGSVSDI